MPEEDGDIDQRLKYSMFTMRKMYTETSSL